MDGHSQPLQYETVDINIIIKNFIASIQNQVVEKGLTISLDLQSNPLESQTEIESFKRILQELLNNAVKYSQHGSNINLKVTQRVEQLIDRVIIEVNNIGRAISKEEATYIFDRFRRGKGRWTPGTGLGLALAKSLVQHLNGSIKVESTPLSEGDNLSDICFTVMLPQFAEDNQPYSNSE